MPELPEVEIVRQSLNRQVKNQKILNIQVNNRKLRLKVPKNFEKIFKNTVIENIQRKSKYLILVFDNHLYCVIHLGMSGTLHFIGLKKKTTNLSFYGTQSLPKKPQMTPNVTKKNPIAYQKTPQALPKNPPKP